MKSVFITASEKTHHVLKNEDRTIMLRSKNIYCVLDGHGGDKAVNKVSTEFVSILTSLNNIEKAINEMDHRLEGYKSGTTLSGVWVHDGIVDCFRYGDSDIEIKKTDDENIRMFEKKCLLGSETCIEESYKPCDTCNRLLLNLSTYSTLGDYMSNSTKFPLSFDTIENHIVTQKYKDNIVFKNDYILMNNQVSIKSFGIRDISKITIGSDGYWDKFKPKREDDDDATSIELVFSH